MGGGGGKTQKVQQFSGPPKQYIPYFTSLFGQAQTAAGRVSDQPYSGDFYAPSAPGQTEAVSLLSGLGRDLQQRDVASPVFDLGLATARGDYLNPETNPYLPGLLSATTRPIMENYTGQLLPSLRASFSNAGAYGGSRQALAEGTLAGGVNRNIGDVIANILATNYAREREAQMQAPGLLQGAIGLARSPAEILASAGDAEQQLRQREIQNALAQFAERNEAPFRPLIPLANILNAIPFGTQASSQSQQYGSTLGAAGQGIAGALGGGALGSAAGSALGGTANPQYGTYGAGLGSILGALAGALGG